VALAVTKPAAVHDDPAGRNALASVTLTVAPEGPMEVVIEFLVRAGQTPRRR
jgi:hypothetical protein